MAGTVQGVEVLTTGVHQSHPYTEKDLDDIVRNFDDFSAGNSPLVKIPVVIGHEEEQPLVLGHPLPIDNTGIPKVGTISKLWKEKGTCRFCKGSKTIQLSDRMETCPVCRGEGIQILLKANIKDVPRSIALLINSRAYDKVSSEIYPPDSLPEGVPASGKLFRRLALLGGELPQIKALSDLPMADYREEQYGELSYQGPPVVFKMSEIRGPYHCFSEIQKMADRNQMMSMLGSYGMSEGMCAALSEEQLSECIKLCSTSNKLSEENLSKLSDSDALAKLNEAGIKRFGEKFKAFAESPHDGSDKYRADEQKDSKQSKEHQQDLQNDVYGKEELKTGLGDMDKQSEKKDEEEDDKDKKEMKHSECSDKEDKEDKEDDKKTMKHSEDRKVDAMSIEKLAEEQYQKLSAQIEARLTDANKRLQVTEERIKNAEFNQRQKEVHEFCEKFLLSGQISPAEMDKDSGLPTIEEHLLSLDCIKVIHKFGEKDLTSLDVEMERIKRRPKPSFQEKIPHNPEQEKKTQDVLLSHVERFCEEHASALKQCKMSKKDFLDIWSSPSTTENDRAELIKGFDKQAYHQFCEKGYFRSVQN